MTAQVTVDTSSLDRGLAKLETGLDRINDDVARQQASQTAEAIANASPVRTGALRSTVTAVRTGAGYGVTYGATLRYAWPMEKKFHPVNSNLEGAERQFKAAAEHAAARVVNSL